MFVHVLHLGKNAAFLKFDWRPIIIRMMKKQPKFVANYARASPFMPIFSLTKKYLARIGWQMVVKL